jgi:hypothetical protein
LGPSHLWDPYLTFAMKQVIACSIPTLKLWLLLENLIDIGTECMSASSEEPSHSSASKLALQTRLGLCKTRPVNDASRVLLPPLLTTSIIAK